jgi:hypothetical protein
MGVEVDFARIDGHRESLGFRTVGETIALAETNVILDPYSTLIARDAEIGSGNVFYPSVVIGVDGGVCVIGDNNTFWPSTVVTAQNSGRIVVGDGCAFGPGGARLVASGPSAELRVGDRVRLLNGAEVLGSNQLGAGTQILGPISAQDVLLAEGGDFTEPDPDRRGAVLKGQGRARGIGLSVGEVINGMGDFAIAKVERQLLHHPRNGR